MSASFSRMHVAAAESVREKNTHIRNPMMKKARKLGMAIRKMY
jgi:hypothetical protein